MIKTDNDPSSLYIRNNTRRFSEGFKFDSMVMLDVISSRIAIDILKIFLKYSIFCATRRLVLWKCFFFFDGSIVFVVYAEVDVPFVMASTIMAPRRICYHLYR